METGCLGRIARFDQFANEVIRIITDDTAGHPGPHELGIRSFKPRARSDEVVGDSRIASTIAIWRMPATSLRPESRGTDSHDRHSLVGNRRFVRRGRLSFMAHWEDRRCSRTRRERRAISGSEEHGRAMNGASDACSPCILENRTLERWKALSPAEDTAIAYRVTALLGALRIRASSLQAKKKCLRGLTES